MVGGIPFVDSPASETEFNVPDILKVTGVLDPSCLVDFSDAGISGSQRKFRGEVSDVAVVRGSRCRADV